ncbi:MAG: sigma 54-interacting transcriptional regulator [Planctomycetota bacterium]|nr:sigma 54-interacting transcriptional regulator [Planctomycetota bacterium]
MTTAIESNHVTPCTGRVLLITHDGRVTSPIMEGLRLEGFDATSITGGPEAIAQACDDQIDVILLDQEVGEEIQEEILQRRGGAISSSLVLLGHSSADTTPSKESEEGLFWCELSDVNKLVETTAMAARLHRLEKENRILNSKLSGLRKSQELVGSTPALRHLSRALDRTSQSDATVLIEGPVGSGKTLSARIIHQRSRRGDRSLVTFSSEAVDVDQLMERALAGDGSTLLLEDIERLSAPAQARLVRLLKESPVCGPKDNLLDRVRIIATTSARLPELVARNQFREDLFYRLNACPVSVPPLQGRRDDVLPLARHFLKQSSEIAGVQSAGFTAEAALFLEASSWPGNVAQLENMVSHAQARASGEAIDQKHLLGPSADRQDVQDPSPGRCLEDDLTGVSEDQIRPFHEEEKRLLGRALAATGGNVRRAAQLLKIGRATLYRKIQTYQLRLQ